MGFLRKVPVGVMRGGDHPSEQLLLELWPGEPWQGVSPRALTRSRMGLFLRRKPPRHEVFFDADQLELWPVEGHTKRDAPPSPSGGAPLLIGLKRTRRGRTLRLEDYDV